MPLSEHEQRLFEQIERSLAEDPKFASAVRATDPRVHTRRRVALAAIVFLAGIALLVYGVVSKQPLVGVAGFLVMLVSVWLGAQSFRGGHPRDLKVVGGRASRRTRSRRGSIVDRLEDRWRGRPEGRS